METSAVREEVIIVGAGGHAKVCIELLRSVGEEIAFSVGGADSPDHCLGIPVLRGDEELQLLRQQGFSRIFVAIGANHVRSRLATHCVALGYDLLNAISPHAVISPSVTIGRGVAIMSGVVINAETAIADLAIINTGATVDHDCQIGMAAHVGPRCALAGRVSIGMLSFLGMGCSVVPGVCIGDRVTVGAGGVVLKDVASDAKVVGVPVRVLGNSNSGGGD